jgi:predicted Zn-dependent protease
VRHFPLVSGGRAAGIGLDQREAGLRDTEPNGGVRNLVLAPGSLSDDELIAENGRPLLEVVGLAWLDVDERAGEFAAGIDLAYLRRGRTRKAVRGGVIAGNVFVWLARARFGKGETSYGWYRGPNRMRVDSVQVR